MNYIIRDNHDRLFIDMHSDNKYNIIIDEEKEEIKCNNKFNTVLLNGFIMSNTNYTKVDVEIHYYKLLRNVYIYNLDSPNQQIAVNIDKDKYLSIEYIGDNLLFFIESNKVNYK